MAGRAVVGNQALRLPNLRADRRRSAAGRRRRQSKKQRSTRASRQHHESNGGDARVVERKAAPEHHAPEREEARAAGAESSMSCPWLAAALSLRAPVNAHARRRAREARSTTPASQRNDHRGPGPAVAQRAVRACARPSESTASSQAHSRRTAARTRRAGRPSRQRRCRRAMPIALRRRTALSGASCADVIIAESQIRRDVVGREHEQPHDVDEVPVDDAG